MPKVATTPTRPSRHEASAEATRPQAAGCDDVRGQDREEETRPRSPQAFYAEMTTRPDVREILKQLADG